MKKFWQKNRGFTMIELIITIAILSFGILGIYSALFQISALNYNNNLHFTATYLAQEGLEIIRNLRDENLVKVPPSSWSNGLSGSPCTAGCQADYKTLLTSQLISYNSAFLNQDSGGFYSYSAGTVTPFKRKITTAQVMVAGVAGEALQVTSTVYWSYGGQQYNFTATEYLYDFF